jgi:HPt (histidine-containing phosphotransfer) domain-containing protein
LRRVQHDDDILILTRLEEAYDDDRAAIASLLGLACETELRYITALRDGIAQNDLLAVARAAHSIKGSASNIGAVRVSRVAAEIEDQAKRDTWDGIAGFAEELDRRYAELRSRVSEYSAGIAD